MIGPSNLDYIDPDMQLYSDYNSMMECSIQSKYYSPDEFRSLCRLRKSLKVLAYNVRSFNANIDPLLALFEKTSDYPDVLLISETWFTSEYKVEIPY